MAAPQDRLVVGEEEGHEVVGEEKDRVVVGEEEGDEVVGEEGEDGCLNWELIFNLVTAGGAVLLVLWLGAGSGDI
jgi:hypothetical protein